MREHTNNTFQILDYQTSLSAIDRFLNRSTPYDEATYRRVKEIIHAVRQQGDAAIREFTKTFDGVTLKAFRLTEREINRAYRQADKTFIKTLETAAANIERFHKHEVEKSFFYDDGDGVIIGQKITPIERVMLYAPGGKAAYPSSVLMNAIPAIVAGVPEIHLTSPCNSQGELQNGVVAAAVVAGVRSLYRLGGAQAIAGFAYGTKSLPKVDKITGPGNRYVALAKQLVFGAVGIDSVAGPSEITIIADEHANATHVVWDLFSQAEHDPDASAVLITPSRALAKSVQRLAASLLPKVPRHEIVREAITTHSAIICVPNLEAACDIANRIAPEHLEVQTREPWALLPYLKHAGAIFLGAASSEPVGDYFAGPNHTLPTSGTARFFSALSARDFQKRTSLISYTDARLAKTGPAIADFADREGLHAHAEAIRVRLTPPPKRRKSQ